MAFNGRQFRADVPGDPATFDGQVRLQGAFALTDRLGISADVGLGDLGGPKVDTPTISLKALLHDGEGLAPSLAASLDLLGMTHSPDGTELGIGLGVVGPMGRFTWRAALSVASTAAAWAPHLHGGVSAATALGKRLHAFAEVVGTVGAGGPGLAAGPGLKVALDEKTSLAAGVKLGLGRHEEPVAFTVVLTQAI